MAASTAVKTNPDTVAEIFKTMSYGPAPEADNVVKVWCLILKYSIAW